MSEPGNRDGANPRRRIWLAALPLLIFLGLAGVFLKQLESGGSGHDIPSALIGKPVPEFSLASLDGLLDESGKAVPGIDTASFWERSPWSMCGQAGAPCRLEHPLIMALRENKDVRIVGINYKDQTANALRFLGQLGNPFDAVGVDPRGSAAIDWGVYGVPETFIVDRNGLIAYKHVGPLTPENLGSKFLPELKKVLGTGQISRLFERLRYNRKMTYPLQPSFIKTIPDGDTQSRAVCENCGFVNYQNPKIVTGSVVRHDGRLLLCRRAIEPRRGFWTIPAGYMEMHETPEDGHGARPVRRRMRTGDFRAACSLYGAAPFPGATDLSCSARQPRLFSRRGDLEVGLFKWDEIPRMTLPFLPFTGPCVMTGWWNCKASQGHLAIPRVSTDLAAHEG
ncbi:MAG: DsbE family thiol:disulfide interchange protein [Nitratireductor sp.]